jgi:hypothetical protein
MDESRTAATFAPFDEDQPCIAADVRFDSGGGGAARAAKNKIFSILPWDDAPNKSTSRATL